MSKTTIQYLRNGMISLLLTIVITTVVPWFAFPWWAAAVITMSNAVAFWFFIRIAVVLESMIRESDKLLIEMKRMCDDLDQQIERTGFVN